MNMLTKQDLKQFGELMDEKFTGFERKMDEKFTASEERVIGKIVLDVGEMVSQQIFPRLDALETKIETLPDKDYLDRKLAPINGKINVLADVLHQNGAISDEQKQTVHSQA